METAKLENINKFSKLGLRRRPTYDEIVNLLDENKKIGMPLPNRDASFFRNSPEGSFFDGPNYLEELKDEQERLLLRQMNEMLLRRNARTAGRTFHTERFRTLPLQSPTIAPPNPMQVDDEGLSGFATPISNAPSNTRLTQGTQLHAELAKRLDTLSHRRQETATNHAQEVAKQTKQTLAEQLANIQPPRLIPEFYPLTSGDTDSDTTQPPRPRLYVDRPQSSNEVPVPVVMDTSSKPKRSDPETRIEPRGKAGRPKMFKHGTERPNAEKRDGSEPEEERPQKRKNKNKEKQRLRLEARIEKEQKKEEEEEEDTGGAPKGEEKEEKEPKERKGSKVRTTIHKPIIPSKVGIQKMYEEFNNAKNKNIITTVEFIEFNDIFKAFRSAKGAEKKKYINQAKDLYKQKLYNKLKKKYDEEN